MIVFEDRGFFIECTPVAIMESMHELEKYKKQSNRCFFVVFTPSAHCIPDIERQQGYDAVFFTPMDALPTYGWDIVLYDAQTHEAIAGIQWRDLV